MNYCRIPKDKLKFIKDNHDKFTIKEISELINYDEGTLRSYYNRMKIGYIHYKKNTIISELEKLLVIEYFYTNYDNSNSAIAKVFNLGDGVVSHVINVHLEEKMKRINKRNYNEIKWGNL